MGALGFGLSGFGLILVWAGIKGENLLEVIPSVFSGQRKFKGNAKPHATPSAADVAAGQAMTNTGGSVFSGNPGATSVTYPMAPPGGAAGKVQS